MEALHCGLRVQDELQNIAVIISSYLMARR